MVANTFIDNAKVMAKGQITIPKDIQNILGISSGDCVTFVAENVNVQIINSAVYAMQILRFSYKTGSRTLNSITSSALFAVIVPLWSSTISFAIASPSPAPPLCELRDVSSL